MAKKIRSQVLGKKLLLGVAAAATTIPLAGCHISGSPFAGHLSGDPYTKTPASHGDEEGDGYAG